ncbi:MAG: alpha/beta fold hydrolase [Ignavibacteria bacterium]|nr:alpha/beta fold hydrolase [Ignavibacteria bacterium]
MIGTVISHYKIIEKLGEGGMGVVYKAHDTKLDRLVALKFLPSHLTASEQDKARFLQEAKAAAALNHPNICTIHGIEEHNDEQFIVMEYVDGKTLRSQISNFQSRTPFNQIVDWGLQIGDALAAAHEKGITHRDIKPDNIMTTSKNQIKVMDFGLAKLKGGLGLTRTATTVGTIAYMSPEQIQSADVDHRTDIWSFGVMLYEMLTGRLPFRGEHQPAIMYSILNEDPQPFEKFRADISPPLKKIIHRALEKPREKRYKTVEELLVDLESLKPTEAMTTTVDRRPQTKYAKSGNVNIAYQVVGNGPVDLVYVMGWVSNLDYFWEEPSYARFLGRLASFSRLILFDKRGTGLSDRVQESELPTLEQRMDDVRAVMDAVGSARAVVFGVSEGGPMSALFAATYPERTVALIMYGSYAKRIRAPDYPWAPTPEERQKFFDAIEQGWGGVVDLATLAPSVAHDEQFKEWLAAYLRRSASPGAALALAKMNTQIDIRYILPTIKVPALIIHRTGDLDIDVGGSKYMVQCILGATYLELPGNDHLPWVGDQEAILREIESFLSSIRYGHELNTVLATVLIVQVDRPDTQLTRGELHATIKKQVELFKGREIELKETRYVAAFDGPARAIRSASAIKTALQHGGTEIKAGLHTGECEIAGTTMRGLAIQVGSQVAEKAGSGEILASRTVKDLVAGSGIRFRDRGTHVLEGLEGEMQLFSVEEGASGIPNKTKEEKSIAVLPFENISPDKENEYFSDGLTEEIIATLSKIRSLKVVSRTSIMRYKGTSKPLKQIGGELQVQYILEGSVRKQGNDLRITAQLIDASQDAHLWVEKYPGNIEDVFDIQEKVAQRVTEALMVQLVGNEQRLRGKEVTRDLEAYDLFLKGRYFMNKRSAEGLEKAIEFFEQAIVVDHDYSVSYSGLAEANTILALLEFLPPKEAFPKARAAAEKAIEIDHSIAEAHAVLGVVKFQYDWDWMVAEREFKRAIELNPNYGTAHHYYADFLKGMGRFNEALVEIKRAKELDPLSLAINTGVGHVLYLSRQYDGAIEQYRKTLELDPNFLQARLWFGRPYLQKGMYEEAITELQAAVQLSGKSTIAVAMLGHAYAASGKKAEGLKMLDELTKRAERQHVPSYWIGMIYVGLGDKDQAFSWFNKAYEERSSWLAWIKVEPRFDSLRSDPRFTELLRKMGLQQ